MPVFLTMFGKRGTIEGTIIFDTVRNPVDLQVKPEDELLYFVHQGVTWKLDTSRGTLHERTVWERADTLARFRRAILRGSAIIFKGRLRQMTPQRIRTYERIIRTFRDPPFVIADDPGIALCLDGLAPTSP